MHASAKGHRGAGGDHHTILSRIYHIYITLHQGAASAQIAFSASPADDNCILLEPSSYPLCTIAGHHRIQRHTSESTRCLGTAGIPGPARTEMTSPRQQARQGPLL